MSDYDAIMVGDWSHRVTLFNEITPEERAECFRTHYRRWLAANRSRLSAEQIASIEEQLAFMTADLYRQPIAEELRREAKELESRAVALFERIDMYQLTLHGDYLPRG